MEKQRRPRNEPWDQTTLRGGAEEEEPTEEPGKNQLERLAEPENHRARKTR